MTYVVFGGTAAYHLHLSDFARTGERRILETPFGLSAPFIHLMTDAAAVWFSSRHGEDGLQRSAAFVNHRANIWAARELGATGILSWNGVGAIAPGLAVGQGIVPDDLLDMTRARLATFADSAGQTPTASPFAADLRERLIAGCQQIGLVCATHGTYVCTEGPRLETAAEIALYGWGGAAVVGMTLAPEVWLAAELGIPYASLCIITNMATGRWHLDPRRDFGPGVGVMGLRALLAACAAA
ncbi:MAG: MTAP family purine nucleoside phosphorylase [Anaerolineae bacterium]|nr:MTAP family purine nucleoside phosphorylase [Anaerolineae bacterium]